MSIGGQCVWHFEANQILMDFTCMYNYSIRQGLLILKFMGIHLSDKGNANEKCEAAFFITETSCHIQISIIIA